MSLPRHTYQVLPTRRMQGTGVPWPHDVHIALPPSYEHGDRSYSVLWVTDASLSFPLAVGLMNWLHTVQELPELIVIGVGAPDESDHAEFSARRTHDFYRLSRWVNAGPGGAHMEALSNEMTAGGGADALLSFLVDELRPRLTSGSTTTTASWDSPAADTSSALHCSPGQRPSAAIWPAALPSADVRTFCSRWRPTTPRPTTTWRRRVPRAGEAELTDPYVAAADIVGSMTRMSQLLRLRNYPSLELTSRLYPRQTHGSALSSALNESLRTL